MKVCVEASSRSKGERIIDRYPDLKRFNYVEVPYKDDYDDDKIKSYIDVKSLDDILMLMDVTKNDVVIHRKTEWDEECFGTYETDYIIEIYDDWRE